MSKNNQNNIIGGIILFCGIQIGFYLYTFASNFFSFSEAVSIQTDPVNAMGIIVNVLLAIYVTRSLTRKNEEERVEKDILIKRLDKFQNNLDENIKKFFSTGNLEFVNVVSKLKTIRKDFNSICCLLKKYYFVPGGDDLCRSIDTSIRDVKDILTDTPRSGENSTGRTSVAQNEIILSTENKQNIENSNMVIKELVFDLIVKINRKK